MAFSRKLLIIWHVLAVAAIAFGSTAVWVFFSTAPSFAEGPAADETLRIKNLSVSVWPEYDDPRLLVIYQGEFADGGTFPREVSFRAPKDASIQMVCALTPKQEHLCQYYDTTFEGDYKIITYKLPIPTFFFEYYDSGTIQEATDKSVSYRFVNPPYTIDSLAVEIQQPLKATNFVINPTSTSVSADKQGLKYYGYNLGAIAADKNVDFAISYTKTDPNPSVEKKQPAASSTQQPNNLLIAVITVGGLAVALMGSYFVSTGRFRRRRYASRTTYSARALQAERRPSSPRPSSHSPAAVLPPSRPAAGSAFCSSCGERLEPDDAFCFSCGEPAKRRNDAPVDRRR